MKTTKGGKTMNPTDAYRKELRKKELKRNKKERKKVREVGILKKDPETLKDQIGKLEAMKADGALDKARKHKKRQLEDTLNLVIKKRKEYEDKMKEKGEAPVMFSHLGPPRRRTAEEEERAQHPQPEDSVYYHPQWNPTGAPPPGKPPMYKSSIGPAVPLIEGSSSGVGGEADDIDSSIPPPPPPPPLPLGDTESKDDASLPATLPLPPPPPMPPKPATSELGAMLPPPPPGSSSSKEQAPGHHVLPPPPPPPQSAPPPPPGTAGTNLEKGQSSNPDESASTKLPPPPPPPGLPPKLAGNQSEGASETKDFSNMAPPPPPPRQQPPGMVHALPVEMLPPGMSRFPPPPPPSDMRPPIGIPGQQPPLPPGMMPPMMPRPPFGPPPMMRPPLPPGPPPLPPMEDFYRPTVPQKPSYVKSAASTVVKRPLAQHTPQLTAMVPASVRVRRESAAPKTKPKPSVSSASVASQPALTPTVLKQPTVKPPSSSAAKPASVDDSYMAFLEDMKALGALDG
ncbi:WW domain binding protein 11 [Artemisia annua]|uniref:WW domain binding protein 11 n=1 Tax=Artemisia annua TaxID=35608 RepID=A0A2U1NVF4_ARTAN|nr:WW domain binding protein 11 [Artemisia annua]